MSTRSDNLAAGFLARVEQINAEIRQVRRKATDDAGHLLTERTLVYQEARDAGVAITPLKAIVKQRELERRIAELEAEMDADEREQYRELAEQFGGSFGTWLNERAELARA
jgi:hypothetical protein